MGLPWHHRASATFGQGIYTPDLTRRTYAECLRVADRLLRAGWNVIVDGAFGRRIERDAGRALARRRNVPFRILWCDAPDAELRARLRARAAAAHDLSDADEGVLDVQPGAYESPAGEPDVERRAPHTSWPARAR